jgi:hypothetical protein
MNAKIKNFTSRLLVIVVCVIALALVLPAPVSAILQIDVFVEDSVNTGINYHNVIVDGGPGDTDNAVNNQINLGSNFEPIPDFIVQGSFHTSKAGGLNLLTSGSSAVNNNRATNTHVTVAVSDTDFKPKASLADVTGSGTFTGAIGSVIHLHYYDDPNNVQGANSLVGVLTPGDLIASFDHTANTALNSFSFDQSNIAVTDDNKYSMTLYFDFSLTPGGQLTSRGQSMFKPIAPVPEFPSVALPAAMVIGLLGVMLFVRRTKE